MGTKRVAPHAHRQEARHGPLSSGEKREYGTLGGGPSPLIQEAQEEGESYRGEPDCDDSYGDVSVTVESGTTHLRER